MNYFRTQTLEPGDKSDSIPKSVPMSKLSNPSESYFSHSSNGGNNINCERLLSGYSETITCGPQQND